MQKIKDFFGTVAGGVLLVFLMCAFVVAFATIMEYNHWGNYPKEEVCLKR